MSCCEAIKIVLKAANSLVGETLMTKWVKFVAGIIDALLEADKMYFFSAEDQMIFNIKDLIQVP